MTCHLLTIATLLVGIFAAEHEEIPAPHPDVVRQYELTDIAVIDGDTIRADIPLGFGVVLDDVTIRFADYDAWESSKRRRSVRVTDEEVERGKEATDFLKRRIAGGIAIREHTPARDRYGRILAVAMVRDGSTWIRLSAVMEAAGHVRK